MNFVNFYADVSDTDKNNSEEDLITLQDSTLIYNTETEQNPLDYYRPTNVTGSQPEAANVHIQTMRKSYKNQKEEFRNYAQIQLKR